MKMKVERYNARHKELEFEDKNKRGTIQWNNIGMGIECLTIIYVDDGS